jgi:Flp pilus assembly pilin Flp
MKDKLRRLFHNSEGQTVVEYGLLFSLIVLVAVTLLTAAQGHGGPLIAMAAAASSR